MFSNAPFSAVAFSAVSGGGVFFATVIESAAASEQVLTILAANSQVTEQAQGADTILSLRFFGSSVFEQARGADTQATIASVRAQVLEQGQGSDAKVQAGNTVEVVLVEGVLAKDLFLGDFLWKNVNTAQGITWVLIKNV